jgi:hypothetical protein
MKTTKQILDEEFEDWQFDYKIAKLGDSDFANKKKWFSEEEIRKAMFKAYDNDEKEFGIFTFFDELRLKP